MAPLEPPEPKVKASLPRNESQGTIPMLLNEKQGITDSQQLHQGELLQRLPMFPQGNTKLIQRQPSLSDEIQDKRNGDIVVKANGIQFESDKDLASDLSVIRDQ